MIHQKFQFSEKRFLITSMFYLHFMIFPSLVSQSINILSCENIGTKKYIYSDNQFLCYSQQHLFIGFPISVTLIILMLILFPAYIYFELKANKNNLFRTQFFLRFKFFFSEYKKSCYYWEIVKFVQKGLIYIGLSIYNENQTTKGALLSFIMALYIRQLYSQQPYKRLFLNKIDYAASFTLLLCFQLGMINMSTNNINIKHSSLYLVILLNTLFFIYFIMLLFKEKIQYNRNNFMFSCIQAALRKLPFLKDYFQLTEKLYLSHRGWKKLQEAIKRVGYQKLTLYCLHKDQKITSSYAHLLGINLQSSESSDEVSIKIKKSKELEKIQTKPSLTSKNLVYKKSIHHLSKLNDLNNKKPIIPKVISSQQQLELVNFSEQSQSLRVANENAFNSEKIEDKIKEDHSLKTECDDNNPELNQKIEEKQVIQTLPDSYNIKTIHSIKTNQCL